MLTFLARLFEEDTLARCSKEAAANLQAAFLPRGPRHLPAAAGGGSRGLAPITPAVPLRRPGQAPQGARPASLPHTVRPIAVLRTSRCVSRYR